ncbi:Retrovirus-related Pol polyprotein from type-1 retrotransposable element R2, partial [Dictyocoela muelleri]
TITKSIHNHIIHQDDLLYLIAENQNEDGRIRRCGWPKITAQYNLKNNTDYNQTYIRNFYLRYLKDKLGVFSNKSENKSHLLNKTTNEKDDVKNDEIKINLDDSNEVKDTKKKEVNDIVSDNLKNMTNEIKNTYKGLKIENVESWQPTPKISSLLLNHKLLTTIDKASEIIMRQEKITNICNITKLIYAAQLTYANNTRKPKPKTNWIDNINRKIEELENEHLIISGYLSDEPLNQEQKKLFRSICLKRRIKKSEIDKTIKKDEVREISFKIENDILLYKKRLDVHFNKKKFLRENFIYECNRKKFYRELSTTNTNSRIKVDKEEIINFWKSQFCEFTHPEIYDIKSIVNTSLRPLETNHDINFEEKLIDSIIDSLPNWKAAGIDRVYNFFIKNLKSIRKQLIKEIQRLCANPKEIPDIYFLTLTYMIPKNNSPKTSDFRTICCMSNIYKLISKVLTHNLYNILEINEVISFNQLGVRKNTMASKEQVIFNHCTNVMKNFKLKTLWFDIQKAFDSVPFEYVNEILGRLNLPSCNKNLVYKVQKNLNMIILINNEKAGMIKPERGIIQGDSLSPLLFTLCMEPISRVLNEPPNPKVEIKYKEANLKINHLLYMDDFKIFAEEESDLKLLANNFMNILNKIGMAHNKKKSCTNADTLDEIADIISPLNGYKYLGLLEDSENNFKNVNLDIMFMKMSDRVNKVCSTNLNSRNMFNALNEFTLSILNYYVGTINITEKQLIDWDTKIRKILMDITYTTKQLVRKDCI